VQRGLRIRLSAPTQRIQGRNAGLTRECPTNLSALIEAPLPQSGAVEWNGHQHPITELLGLETRIIQHLLNQLAQDRPKTEIMTVFEIMDQFPDWTL